MQCNIFNYIKIGTVKAVLLLGGKWNIYACSGKPYKILKASMKPASHHLQSWWKMPYYNLPFVPMLVSLFETQYCLYLTN